MPMRVGERLRARLIYSVYADNKIVLPAGTIVGGEVVSLTPDRSRRINARLRVDFTPYHTPVVRFDSILPPNGAPIPIETGEATDGAPVFRVVPKPAPKGVIIGQYFQFGVQYVKQTITTITGPEKGDRAKQFVYRQLPYHPERIARATAWTVETDTPITLAPLPVPPVVEPKRRKAKPVAVAKAAPAEPGARPSWMIEAYLDDAISSETSHADQVIHATVAQPVLNADGSIAVPQGAQLIGTVSQAKPARKFTRAGVLRFGFSELKLPDQEATQHVRTSLAGADSSSAQQLAMDSEGQVKPKAQDKIFIPALLVILASQPFDRDHHDGMAGKDAVASSSLGLISLIVGTAAQQPNFAIGLGFYSAALSIYPRYFAKGKKVAFPKDTRIVIQTTPTRSTNLRPTPTQSSPAASK